MRAPTTGCASVGLAPASRMQSARSRSSNGLVPPERPKAAVSPAAEGAWQMPGAVVDVVGADDRPASASAAGSSPRWSRGPRRSPPIGVRVRARRGCAQLGRAMTPSASPSVGSAAAGRRGGRSGLVSRSRRADEAVGEAALDAGVAAVHRSVAGGGDRGDLVVAGVDVERSSRRRSSRRWSRGRALDRPQVEQARLGDRTRGARVDAAAAGDAGRLAPRPPVPGATTVSAPRPAIVEREGALHLVAHPHAAAAGDAQVAVELDVGVGVVALGRREPAAEAAAATPRRAHTRAPARSLGGHARARARAAADTISSSASARRVRARRGSSVCDAPMPGAAGVHAGATGRALPSTPDQAGRQEPWGRGAGRATETSPDVVAGLQQREPVATARAARPRTSDHLGPGRRLDPHGRTRRRRRASRLRTARATPGRTRTGSPAPSCRSTSCSSGRRSPRARRRARARGGCPTRHGAQVPQLSAGGEPPDVAQIAPRESTVVEAPSGSPWPSATPTAQRGPRAAACPARRGRGSRRAARRPAATAARRRSFSRRRAPRRSVRSGVPSSTS